MPHVAGMEPIAMAGFYYYSNRRACRAVVKALLMHTWECERLFLTARAAKLHSIARFCDASAVHHDKLSIAFVGMSAV